MKTKQQLQADCIINYMNEQIFEMIGVEKLESGEFEETNDEFQEAVDKEVKETITYVAQLILMRNQK